MSWDTLGMRGTCSSGFTLKGVGETRTSGAGSLRENSGAYDDAGRTLDLGCSMDRAGGCRRRARASFSPRCSSARQAINPRRLRLISCERRCRLRALEGIDRPALQRFEAIRTNESELDSLEFQTAMNLLKVNASEMATSTVMSAMQACGLSGYRNDGEFSVARHVRDVLSSSIMINNERILANAATPSLLVEVPGSIRA